MASRVCGECVTSTKHTGRRPWMATIARMRGVLKGQVAAGKTEILAACGVETIEAVCRDQNHEWRDRFWTPLQTLWTFLWQVLHVDSSCREAVAAVLAEQARAGGEVASEDPSAYCQARKRLPLEAVRSSVRHVGRCLREQVCDAITAQCLTRPIYRPPSASPTARRSAAASRWPR